MAAAASPPSSSLPSPPPLSSSDPQPETQQEEEENSSPLETSSSSISSLTAAAALVVAEAEAPLRWAPPRERWALRKLPQSKEMGREQLEQLLRSAFEASPALREELGGEVLLLLSLSSSKKKSGGKQEEKETRRCLAACLRSAAFLAAGDCEQALRDARAAVARAPAPSSSSSSRHVLPLRAAASALLASSLEASGEKNSQALLEWLRCLSSGDRNGSGAERRAEASAAVERLRRRVPASHAAATAAAAAGDKDSVRAAALSLSSLLSREAQDLLPEVMRPRPKYYHYFKWTTKRIKAANGGTLPPPEVLRLLLACPAGDLDDVLSHPVAAPAAVARLTAAFERGGAEALGAAEKPRLTWEEMREVQAWREGREAEEEEQGGGGAARALEGGRGEEEGQGQRRQQLPAPVAEGDASASAAACEDEDEAGSEPELDLDALDF